MPFSLKTAALVQLKHALFTLPRFPLCPDFACVSKMVVKRSFVIIKSYISYSSTANFETPLILRDNIYVSGISARGVGEEIFTRLMKGPSKEEYNKDIRRLL